MDYENWCALTNDELADRDIAEANLAVAAALPGAEDLDVPALLGTVDQWASVVRQETKKALRQRARRLSHREFSDAQFRILAMITTLQLKLGVKYNQVVSEGESDASDSRTIFIHGLLTGYGGTCATMPVLYAAIGRRLGYPIKLALAMEHVYCRWDDPSGERFNIEATSRGFVSYMDDEYLTWPLPIPENELKKGRFLRSLSPREELALFFADRGYCCMDNVFSLGAPQAFSYAMTCAPHDEWYMVLYNVSLILHDAIEELRRQAKINPFDHRLAMPAPQSELEKKIYPIVEYHFKRIISNRKAKRRPNG